MAGVVEIVDLRKEEVMAAIAQPVKDFEDMLQYQCAKTAGCDYIVRTTAGTMTFPTFSTLRLPNSSVK